MKNILKDTDVGEKRVKMESNALHYAHKLISEEMVSRRLGLSVNVCYVDEESGSLVVGVTDDNMATRQSVGDLVSDVPLRFFPCAPAVRHTRSKSILPLKKPVNEHTDKQGLNRPLIGGILIKCPGLDPPGQGTICIATKRQEVDGFITCGHVVENKETMVYQPRRSEENDWLAGKATVVSDYKDYKNTSSSDSAFVAAAKDVKLKHNAIWKSKDEVYNVTKISEPLVATEVKMQGASTKETLRSGIICAQEVTVTFEDGAVLENQLLANYRSVEGDSGAPVFVFDDKSENEVSLIGLNVGATTRDFVKLSSDDLDKYPPEKTTDTYAVISPWMNVVKDLELNGLAQQEMMSLQSKLNYALSDEPILLNGMKVIFDQPTPVYPVGLQLKDE